MKIVGIHLEPGPVGWYRCWNWTTALNLRGHDVKHHPHESKQFEWHEIDDYLRGTDVVIAGRMHHAQVFAALMAGRDIYKYKLVVDIDDAADVTPKYNQSFVDYHSGTGMTRIVRGELREADLVTVSTAPLKEWADKYAKRTVIVPNCVSPHLYSQVRTRQKEARHQNDIRIYWGGGGGHYDDLLVAKDALLRVFHERPNVKLIFSNFLPDWAVDLPPFRVFMVRFAHFNAYPKVLKWLCADVAIAPLVDNEFNRCKSHVKWLDYSMAGIPGVYSDLEPYSTVEHGVTGLKARNSQEWYDHIGRLIDEKEFAGRIAMQAREEVLSRWTINHHIGRYESMLQELVDFKVPKLQYLREGEICQIQS